MSTLVPALFAAWVVFLSAVFVFGYSNLPTVVWTMTTCPPPDETPTKCVPVVRTTDPPADAVLMAEAAEGLLVASAVAALALLRPRVPASLRRSLKVPRAARYAAVVVLGTSAAMYAIFVWVNVSSINGLIPGPGTYALAKLTGFTEADAIMGGSFSLGAFRMFALACLAVFLLFLDRGVWPAVRSAALYGFAPLLLVNEVPLALTMPQELGDHVANYWLGRIGIGGSFVATTSGNVVSHYIVFPLPLVSNLTLLIVASALLGTGVARWAMGRVRADAPPV